MQSSTMIRGPSTPFAGAVHVATRPRDQLTPHLAEDLLDLMAELATEIRNDLGDDNVMLPRLRAMRDRIDMARIVVEGREP